MKIKQFYLKCLAHASYLIGDEETKLAVIVDPQRDIDQYLEEATRNGWRIQYVFLTHFHADFLAGHVELHEKTGAEICLGQQAVATFPFKKFKDGDTLTFGKVRIQVLETPGHTPESISLVVYDLDKSENVPQAVLTGDTLFIGDVGRPDLMASSGISAEELAGQLFHSLHQKLLALPDETLVYPAHGAGSMCGKNLSSETVSTLGRQRWENYALQPMTAKDFISLVTRDQPEAPSYFGYDAQLNREPHASLEQVIHQGLTPLTLEAVLHHQNQGAQVLDVRSPSHFASGHLRGSLNISLTGKFATWAGTLLPPERSLIIVADPGYEREAIQRLGRIGFDHVAGYLQEGIHALRSRPDLVKEVQRISAQFLGEQLTTDSPPLVLDVRGTNEWEAGHIDGSLHIPLPHLTERLNELPEDRPLVVHCASGYRSSIAMGLLEISGRSHDMELIGGYEAWVATWSHPRRAKTPTHTTSCTI